MRRPPAIFSLPAPLQALAPAEQEALIQETIVERNEVQQKIRQLAEVRSSYLKEKVEALGDVAKDVYNSNGKGYLLQSAGLTVTAY